MFSIFKNILGSEGEKKSSQVSADAVFIDVRSQSEFDSGHLEGALHIPLEVIQSKADIIKGFPQAILYCRSGNRSAHAVQMLNALGLTNVLDGGSVFSAQEWANASGHFSLAIVRESGSKPAATPAAQTAQKEKAKVKVLIPTDFSVQADFSYLMVKKLEEHLDIDLHFLHVLDVPDTVTMSAEGEIDTCGEIDVAYVKQQKRIAEEKLKQLKIQYGGDIHTHFLLGKVTDTLKDFAESHHFDLIVMGTKGSWGIREKLSTTQAQIVSRKCRVPLLTLMCDRSDLVIGRVLLVNDFSMDTDVRVPLAQAFSKHFKAHFSLLHFVGTESSEHVDAIHAKMDEFAKVNGISSYDKNVSQARNVESGVHDFLESADADLILIGTHDYGGPVNRAAAESLIKHVFKPIITVHL
jgi:rhodanese-related sulfurtransferase/nucleotide-binding universal stress UspA family protein